MLTKLQAEIKKLADPKRARASLWFFKTGPGQYGYGDKFFGLRVPLQRAVAAKYQNLGFADLAKMLKSPWHELRFIALEILVMQYEAGSADKGRIVKFYLQNTRFINNWDLVDTSAPYILGDYLLTHPRRILYQLAASKNLWERRIAIVSTAMLISRGQFNDTLKLSKILLADFHDLIHKAVGWMLREVGKRDEKVLLKFLDQNCTRMPRTALRYSIERLPVRQKRKYMAMK